MQRCSKCGRSYEDDTQKFCTFDGGRLMRDEMVPTVDLNDTVRTDTPEPPPEPYNAPTQPQQQPPPSPPPQQWQPQPPAPDADLYKTVAGVSFPPSQQQPPPPRAPEPPTPTTQFDPRLQSNYDPAKTIAHFPYTTPPASAPPSYEPPQPTSPSLPPPTPPPSSAYSQQQPSAPLPSEAQYSAQQYSSPYSAPLPSAPLPPQHQQQYEHDYARSVPHSAAAAPAPRKSSKMPLILGGVAVLLLIIIGAVGGGLYYLNKQGKLFGSGSSKNANNSNTDLNTNSNANEVANTNENANNNTDAGNTNENANNANNAVETPPPNSEKFTNARENLDSNLSAHYVDFSFYYPKTWQLDPKAGKSGSSNFVQVVRSLSSEFIQESMAVSWYESGGTIAEDRAKFPDQIKNLDETFKKNFAEYQKLSEGETQVNGINGYEMRFQSISRGTSRGDVTLWGRVIFLPTGNAGDKSGLRLLLLTTSLAPELQSINDVGVKGELPIILNSFRLGKSATP